MKEQITIIAMAALVAGCGGKKGGRATSQTHVVPDSINLVQANGKVMPENGMVYLSADIAGRVQKICATEGQQVEKGQTLIILDPEIAELKEKKATADMQEQEANVEAARAAMEKARIELEHARKKMQASQALYQTGAETRLNYLDDKEKAETAEKTVRQNEQQLRMEQRKLTARKQDKAIARQERQKCRITAPKNGRLLNIDTEVGSTAQPYEQLATFAPDENVIVEAEVDELFAPRLKVGQKVSIRLVGYQQVVATGKIYKLMDFLSEKSIFSGENQEKQDRQMRRIKIMLDNQREHPLLGTKVICDIQL